MGLSQDVINAIHSSVKAIFDLLPADSAGRNLAIAAYVNAVRNVWLVCVPCAALAGFGALFLGREWLKKVEGIM